MGLAISVSWNCLEHAANDVRFLRIMWDFFDGLLWEDILKEDTDLHKGNGYHSNSDLNHHSLTHPRLFFSKNLLHLFTIFNPSRGQLLVLYHMKSYLYHVLPEYANGNNDYHSFSLVRSSPAEKWKTKTKTKALNTSINSWKSGGSIHQHIVLYYTILYLDLKCLSDEKWISLLCKWVSIFELRSHQLIWFLKLLGRLCKVYVVTHPHRNERFKHFFQHLKIIWWEHW